MFFDRLPEKQRIRELAHANRAAQADKEQISRAIVRRLVALCEYEAARSVAFYVDVRDEVRTRFALPQALVSKPQIAVPYCDSNRLRLFQLHDVDELAAGRFGVLEPRIDLRDEARRAVDVEDVDLIVVPGVAFDRHGGRVGHGLGYYDRMLSGVRATTVLVGLAFECQVFAEVPLDSHDISMDRVITESTTYIGRGHQLTPAR